MCRGGFIPPQKKAEGGIIPKPRDAPTGRCHPLFRIMLGGQNLLEGVRGDELPDRFDVGAERPVFFEHRHHAHRPPRKGTASAVPITTLREALPWKGCRPVPSEAEGETPFGFPCALR